MTRTSPLTKKTVRSRSVWLLILFLVSATFSYARPANWLFTQLDRWAGIRVGPIDKPFVLGLDLQGGTHLEYEAELNNVPLADRKEALGGVRDVIERRINTLGVSEPMIQTTQAGDSWRVTVELAGISDINQAIKLIGETPILEFKDGNDQKTVPLTDAQKQEIVKKNIEARERAEAVLVEAEKPGADFAALARIKSENSATKDKGGDVGFIGSQSEYSDLLTELRSLARGTVVRRVLDRPQFYTLAKVEEMGTEIRAHHLLISYQGAKDSSSTLTKEQAKAKIDELKKQATVRNFDSLVVQNSQEPGAAKSRGDLGWFGRGAMVPSFEQAVFAQRVGTISEVVESPFGYHLIWKIDERPNKDVRVSLIEFKKTTAEELAPKPDEWKSTGLTGKQLAGARVDFDPQVGTPLVSLQFNDEGTKLFADITKRNLNKPVAIFLDGQIISQPIVQSEIVGGRAVIQGNFGLDEAKLLARRLQAGALPVPVKLIAQQTVGPTLGADSLARSLKAGLIGFALVALFMILLYRLPGVVSVVALLLYAAMSAAFFKLIPVTLTLSGIAGFILSLGIALDANVLVFERLKEELSQGKSLATALEDAFQRAWPSIRDGHVTVLISCAVLYWFSSSIIRGFALTLATGTIISLFTAIVSTRTILRLLAGTIAARFGWLFLQKPPRS